jgi:hypothetical protein
VAPVAPVDADDPEVCVPGDPAADDEMPGPDDPVRPPAVGVPGADPEPTDGSPLAEGTVTEGSDGVETVGVRIVGTGTGGGAGSGSVTAGTVGVGSVGVDTVGVGTDTVGTETVGTEIVVETVSAGLEWAPTSSASITPAKIAARVTGATTRVQPPARRLSRLRTPLQPPVIARE